MASKKILGDNLMVIEWSLGALAILLPLAAWLGSVTLSHLTIYDIFPPLGLVAFGLMGTHFIMGALRRFSGAEKTQSGVYMSVSMGLVLALIILHPALLWLGLYSDGYGLPPFSYLTVYSTQLVFVLLGTFGLLIFLAFELKRVFGKKQWWKYVEYLQVIGMAAIFVHAIGLGRELKLGWFMVLWVLYGLSLVVAVVYSNWIYKSKEKKRGTK